MTSKTSSGRSKRVVSGTVASAKRGRAVAKRAGEKTNALRKVARRAKV